MRTQNFRRTTKSASEASLAPREPSLSSAACASPAAPPPGPAPRRAEGRDIGRLALLQSLPAVFAQRRRARLGVEDVGRPPGKRARPPSRTGRGSRAPPRRAACRRQRRSATRGADQRPGLVDVHELELGEREASCRSNRGRFSGRRPCRGSRRRSRAASPSRAARCGSSARRCSAAAEKRASAARRPPAVRSPRHTRRAPWACPAQHVVVHAGQVVVHERVGVDQSTAAPAISSRSGAAPLTSPAARRATAARAWPPAEHGKRIASCRRFGAICACGAGVRGHFPCGPGLHPSRPETPHHSLEPLVSPKSARGFSTRLREP